AARPRPQAQNGGDDVRPTRLRAGRGSTARTRSGSDPHTRCRRSNPGWPEQWRPWLVQDLPSAERIVWQFFKHPRVLECLTKDMKRAFLLVIAFSAILVAGPFPNDDE